MSGNQPRIDPTQPPFGLADSAATRNNFVVLQGQIDTITGYNGTSTPNPPSYVPLSGGAMTGTLTVDAGGNGPALVVTNSSQESWSSIRFNAAAPGDANWLRCQKAGVDRWTIMFGDTDPEIGQSWGSNIRFFAYDDTGAALSPQPHVLLVRQTGEMRLSNGRITAAGAAFGAIDAQANLTPWFTCDAAQTTVETPLLVLTNLPTADPHVLGAVWMDTGNILRASQG